MRVYVGLVSSHLKLIIYQLIEVCTRSQHFRDFMLISCNKLALALIFAFRFFYYTAGSGGAGPTILATSFLLLGEEVIAYNKGSFPKT